MKQYVLQIQRKINEPWIDVEQSHSFNVINMKFRSMCSKSRRNSDQVGIRIKEVTIK